MKRGFTLIELLVVVVIIGILLALILPLVGGCRGCTGGYYGQEITANYRCVKTYTVTSRSDDTTQSSKRVDLEPESGGAVVTMVCDDDMIAGVSNSATLYAQFEAGQWYRVTSLGYRREGFVWATFPMVTAVRKILHPQSEQPVRAEATAKDFAP